MGWKDVSLAEVTPTFENIPKGDYTFELVGASYREDKSGAPFTDISVRAAIVGGEYAGRQMFLDYPDPDRAGRDGKRFDWSKQALKRLEQALGVEQAPGQDLIEMLDAARGFHFGAPVDDKSYKNAAGETVERTGVSLFKVRPAA